MLSNARSTNQFLLILCFAAFGLTSWARTIDVGDPKETPDGNSRVQTVPTECDSRELVALICDDVIPDARRREAFYSLLRLNGNERTTALREIVTRNANPYDVEAAILLVRANDPHATRLLIERIVRWRAESQVQILSTIASHRSKSAFHEIPQRLLESLLQSSSALVPSAETCEVVGRSAMILATFDQEADHASILKSVHLCPMSFRPWLATRVATQLTGREAELGAAVMQDATATSLVRAAASVALSTEHPEAEATAIREIENYLAAFGDVDVGSLLHGLRSDDQLSKQEYVIFRENLRLIGILVFVNSDRAEEIATDALEVRNEQIRLAVGLVCALRWPQRIIEARDNSFSPRDMNRLLAAVTYFHPDLKTRIRERLSEEKMEELLAEFKLYGLEASFGTAGVAVLGF